MSVKKLGVKKIKALKGGAEVNCSTSNKGGGEYGTTSRKFCS